MGYLQQLLARQPPDKLYHYTSVEGIAGILHGRSVRATVVHYLNDSQEFRHAFGVARSIISRKTAGASDNDLTLLLSHLSASLERIEHVRIAVFSLTEEGDLLSQWRGYCPPGGGYSIAFSPTFLRSSLEKHGFFLAPCTYQDFEHQALVEEVVDHTVETFQSVKKTWGGSFDELKERILSAFFYPFSRVAPVIKHRSFAEEREWRIVSGPIANDNPHLNHRIGKSMLVPYYDLPLGGDGSTFAVEEIVVGPTPHQYIATDSLMSLLRREGVTWQSVKASRIPYRQL